MPDLFDYQKRGSLWLKEKHFALLADEMGLGKSAQAITAADKIGACPILVLCPAVARLNWANEFSKFSARKLTCLPLLSGGKDLTQSTVRSHDVTICSYDLATTKNVLSVLSQIRWAVCVLDEAHYLKSRTAKRTKAVLGAIARNADRVWALTGTPAPNNPSELWPLLRFGGVAKLDYWGFTRRYCYVRETPFGTHISGGRNLDELREAMAPVLLRRRKSEVMKDMPPIRFDELLIEPTPLAKEVFDVYFDQYWSYPPERRWQVFTEQIAEQSRKIEALAEAGFFGEGNANLVPEDAVKVLSAAAPKVKSLRRYTGLQKVPKVLELVRDELKSRAYDKIVLFAVHKDVICELTDGLAAFGAVKLYGGTSPARRHRTVHRFQNDKKCRVFVGQVTAAGTAITLTAAHNVLFVEADWTPANNQQAAMRVHRIGQTKPVTVRFAAIPNSIDQQIQKVLRQKTRVLVNLFDKKATAFSQSLDVAY